MSDDYTSGHSAGLGGGGPDTDGGINYQLGYIEGKRARESGGPQGAGVGVLALSFALCWLYPMVGASVATVGLIFYLGADTFPRSVLVLLIALGVVAWFFGFKLERFVSRSARYRRLRDVIRCGVFLYPFVSSLVATGRDVPTGGTMVGYLLVCVVCFLLIKRADRVLGFLG